MKRCQLTFETSLVGWKLSRYPNHFFTSNCKFKKKNGEFCDRDSMRSQSNSVEKQKFTGKQFFSSNQFRVKFFSIKRIKVSFTEFLWLRVLIWVYNTMIWQEFRQIYVLWRCKTILLFFRKIEFGTISRKFGIDVILWLSFRLT